MIKKLKLRFEELKEGDIVTSWDKENMYFVLREGKTFFHNHKFIEVIYQDGQIEKLSNNFDERPELKRIVYRFY